MPTWLAICTALSLSIVSFLPQPRDTASRLLDWRKKEKIFSNAVSVYMPAGGGEAFAYRIEHFR